MEGVEEMKDLKPGMILEGVVTNVANFGAFVDIGVHQDGLVHISALADTFVKDPRDVVKAGDIVKVKVMDVDLPRKRIALSCRMSDQPGDSGNQPMGEGKKGGGQARSAQKHNQQQSQMQGNTLGDLLKAAQKQKKRRPAG